MPRAIFRFNDESYLNITADSINRQDGWICAWNGDELVAFAKEEAVLACYITEKKEGASDGH